MKIYAALIALTLAVALGNAQQQPPAGGPPGGGGRGRGGGLPGATAEQTQAVSAMNATLAPLVAAESAARNDLMTATFSGAKNDAAIDAAIDKLKLAERALATKRAEEFAKLQAGPNKLNPEQVTALIAMGAGGRGGGGGRGPMPPQ